jgi:hypothetical protein
MTRVDHLNAEFQSALSFINRTNRHLFLTGKAGTGKTTFLRFIREKGFKKMAVVAPTGVAAINAGGVTIHSFFQIPPGTFVPTAFGFNGSDQRFLDQHSLLRNLRMSAEKRELMNELELLVIDEVSMVRADLLDAIDVVLRHVRRVSSAPFGGVQVLYIGDLFQLPPVVKQDEWKYLANVYNSPFFFDAMVVKEQQPLYLELQKVYRQKDDKFIGILNNIRNNICSPKELDILHDYYQPEFVPPNNDHYITLTTHNEQANMINHRELRKLPGEPFSFKAEISGDFPDNAFPAEEVLHLKKNAQVMFIKNDKGESRRYFNGKIATIHSFEHDKLIVSFPDENDLLELKKETWQNIRYSYNKGTDRIEEEELGSFKQYPIRLAWAITIHKSQGLTFDKAVIDAGSSFAAGQVYVALSRLTSLNGLVLKSRILPHCIQTDERVLQFVNAQTQFDNLDQLLSTEQKEYMRNSLLQKIGWEKLIAIMEMHVDGYEHRLIPDQEECLNGSKELLSRLLELQEIASRFRKQLEGIFPRCEEDHFLELQSRVDAGCSYFIQQLDEKLIRPLNKQIQAVKIKKRVTSYVKELNELKRRFEKKKQEFGNVQKMMQSLVNAENGEGFDISIEELHKPIVVHMQKEKKVSGESHRISLEMFKDGMSIADIASARSMVVSTIEGHLSHFIPTGEIDVLQLVTESKLQRILSLLNDQPTMSSSIVKEQLGEAFSYGEIRAAIKYKETLPGGLSQTPAAGAK